MIDNVLMVCTGNICRSPMAEGLLRARFARLGRGKVESAGLGAVEGRPADPIAVELLAERGIDLTQHRSRQITPEMLARFDLVLVMDEAQRRHLTAIAPSFRGRIRKIGGFSGFDVPDPYRAPRHEFERTLELIERGLSDLDRAFWRKAS